MCLRLLFFVDGWFCVVFQRAHPTDEDVCSTLSSVLHLCGETRRAVRMFEAAVAASPSSVPLQRDLFFSYVLVGEAKQQQLVRLHALGVPSLCFQDKQLFMASAIALASLSA